MKQFEAEIISIKTNEVKPLKWMPKDGDIVWYILDDLTIVNGFYNENLYYLLEKDLLFKTEEECKKFSKYCLSYFNNKKKNKYEIFFRYRIP